jgi:hypothetical protein
MEIYYKYWPTSTAACLPGFPGKHAAVEVGQYLWYISIRFPGKHAAVEVGFAVSTSPLLFVVFSSPIPDLVFLLEFAYCQNFFGFKGIIQKWQRKWTLDWETTLGPKQKNTTTYHWTNEQFRK